MELSLSKKKLEILSHLDALRDASEHPDGLLNGVVEVMVRGFDAEACLLFGPRKPSEEAELKAISNRRGDTLSQIPRKDLARLLSGSLDTSVIEIREAAALQRLLPGGDGSLQMAVVPIIMGATDRTGTLLLIRAGTPFSSFDKELLQFAEEQLDSALAQAKRMHDLNLRNLELETIYRVDRIRDSALDFDEMLDRVLAELRGVMQSDLAFILLYDRAGKELEIRGNDPKELMYNRSLTETLKAVAYQAAHEGDLVVREGSEGEFASYMCVPLILREEVLGVFGVAAKTSEAFGEGEQRLLRAIASQMDTAIFENLERGRLRKVLDRTVDPRVMQRLLEAPDVGILEGERLVLSVLYADLRGSTRLAETVDPKHLVEFLNDFLAKMADVILEHEGTLDKFMGDEVMALFGAPLPFDDHAFRAVQVGLEMQEAHREIMRRWTGKGLEVPPLGVGIATGEMIVGELGSGRRSDYTVLGAPANLGARIQGLAEGGQVLVSSETRSLLGEKVEASSLPPVRFKGITEEVTVYEVTGLG